MTHTVMTNLVHCYASQQTINTNMMNTNTNTNTNTVQNIIRIGMCIIYIYYYYDYHVVISNSISLLSFPPSIEK